MWILKDIITVIGLVIIAVIAIINAIGLGFHIKDLREQAVLWGLNWFEILSCILTLSFIVVVCRLMKRLNRYEKESLSLWIRQMGVRRLYDSTKHENPSNIAWYFEINIANTSQVKTLNIRSVVLKRIYVDKPSF